MLIRTIGEPRQRFGEDKLRLLRGVRFAANLGYEIDPATFDAVKEKYGKLDYLIHSIAFAPKEAFKLSPGNL